MTVTSRSMRTSKSPPGFTFSWNRASGACSGRSGKSSRPKRRPRSSTQTLCPASARRQAAMPPPKPDPITIAS
jgi:hypothetical protein